MKKVIAICMAMVMLCMPRAASAAASDDLYESNDTRATAYAYSNIPTMTDTVTTVGTLYQLGYKTACLSSKDDVDWYKVTLSKGVAAYADIHNLALDSDVQMDIYLGNEEIPLFSTTKADGKFDGKTEKYYEFTPATTGTYYLKIYCTGKAPTSNYFFYIGPQNREFSFDVHMKGIQINPIRYETSTTNLSSAYFPESAEFQSFSLSNDFTGSGTVTILKKVQVHGKTYTSTGTSTAISGMSGVKAAGVYVLSGQVKSSSGNSGVVIWGPRATGTFRCKMEPYPGNRVD